jgi:hypothetical protein
MNRQLLALAVLCTVLVACGKKAEVPEPTEGNHAASNAPAAEASAPVTENTPATDAAVDESVEAQERARKQAVLDYATMENNYITDVNGQWATSGKASASYAENSDGGGVGFGSPNAAAGPPDSTAWTPKQNQIGIDWLEVSFAKPVAATELRMVLSDGVGSVSKIEVIDTDGKAHEAWSGVDEMQPDPRGGRTWYVTPLKPAPYKVSGARYSFAHALNTSAKYVDAVQLVGE